jgi:tRNA-dihydrouridine synthase
LATTNKPRAALVFLATSAPLGYSWTVQTPVLCGVPLDPPFALGPMADLTDPPFRRLISRLGGCGLFYTPMLTSSAVRALEANRLAIDTGLPDAPPLVAQLAPACADDVLDALPRVLGMCAPAAVDVNMGCSAPRVRKRGAGTSLLADRARIRLVLGAVRGIWPGPITAKIRLPGDGGYDALAALVSLLEDCGVSCVCVHGRTAAEGFRRTARWEPIAALASSCGIPVIGSGDVLSAGTAVSRLERSGCAAVLIARAALRDPWIFRRVERLRAGRELAEPSHEELTAAILSLVDDIRASYDTAGRAAARIGLVVGHLFDRFHFGRRAALEIAGSRDPARQRALVARFLERAPESGLTSKYG